MFSILKKLILICVLISLVLCPILLISLVTDRHAQILPEAKLNYDDLKRAKQILKTNKYGHNRQNYQKTLHLSEKDINLLLVYGLAHGLEIDWVAGKSKVQNDVLYLSFTFTLPEPFSGRFINLTATLRTSGNLIEPAGIRIGNIQLPEKIVAPAAAFFHSLLLQSSSYRQIWQHTQLVENIFLTDQQIKVVYTLDRNALEEIKKTGRSIFLTDSQQLKLIGYHNHLAGLTRTYRAKKDFAAPIIKEMFSYAARETNISGDAVLENTTAILALSFYVAQKPLHRVVSPDYQKKIQTAHRIRMTFFNRTDLPKHFFISAALAVSTGSRFAGLMGLIKEVKDTDGGSGFSFADIAADKAGVKFGQTAITSPEQALLFQNAVSKITDISHIMPSIRNLPEGIMELEFRQTYTDIDSSAYNLINTEIENRLAACRIYRKNT